MKICKYPIFWWTLRKRESWLWAGLADYKVRLKLPHLFKLSSGKRYATAQLCTQFWTLILLAIWPKARVIALTGKMVALLGEKGTESWFVQWWKLRKAVRTSSSNRGCSIASYCSFQLLYTIKQTSSCYAWLLTGNANAFLYYFYANIHLPLFLSTLCTTKPSFLTS